MISPFRLSCLRNRKKKNEKITQLQGPLDTTLIVVQSLNRV